MKLFGFQITRAKEKALTAINSVGGWFNILRESFGGAFQSAVEVDAPRGILAFSAVFSCVTGIASDIGKLRIKLVEEDDKGIAAEVKKGSSFLAVLKKPNHFQNRIKFIEQWILSKLLFGNTYVLKQRDKRGKVIRLYILDAQRVTPLVAENGDVYYQLSSDHLAGLPDTVTVPASEIIHDTMCCLWHPLVGIPPIYACAMSATMGNKIQANSTKFFDNMSRPSGALTAPGAISDETAKRLKESFETNFSGGNIGRLAVLGDGLEYTPMTIPAHQAQLIEQLEWSVQDVGRCFHYPLYKLGGAVPANNNVDSLNQQYYSECLHPLIESAELCLDEGLGLEDGYYTEFDLDGLLRMDTAAQYKALGDGVKGSLLVPNEARKKLNLPPVKGGDAIYMQQQNYSLEALARRDAKDDPFAKDQPAKPTVSDQAEDEESNEQAVKDAKELIEYISKGLACST